MALVEDNTDAIPTAVEDHGGARILVVGGRAHFADIGGHVNGLITEAWSQNVPTIAIPVECLPEDFFLLRSGVAVSISQKLVNYRITVAFVGNIADKLLDSQPLGDFIRDCNRGRWIWFVEDMRELATRLAGRNR
jgi:hypothetical protein